MILPAPLDNNIRNLPSSKDFTQAAIKKALQRTAMDHWTFRYMLPALAGTALVGVLFGFSFPVFVAMLGIVGGSAATFLYKTMFNNDAFSIDYIAKLHKIIDDYTVEKRDNLKEELNCLGQKHAALQLEQFDLKLETMVDVLNQKFEKSQLTYQRYYSIAKEVYLSGIDNLNNIVIASKTMKSIDLTYIQYSLQEIEKKDQSNLAVKKELDALLRSKESYGKLKNRIDEILAENETALTQIDQTTISISEITRNKNNEGQVDMENSMKALEEMAVRSTYYSR